MSNGKLNLGILCALGLCCNALACDAGGSSEETTDAATSNGPGGETTAGEEGESTAGEETAATSADETGDGGEIEPEPANVIDDLEDGDPVIFGASGRQGAWYTYNDETAGAEQLPPAPFAPSEGGPGTSLYQAQTSGSGFTTWGAGLGLDLNNEGDPEGGDGIRMPYDASAHQGIVFHARGNTAIRVKLLIGDIIPVETGGSCMADCEDAHGKIVPLSEEWAQYTVDFDEAFQEGWGAAAAFDATNLMSIQFQVSASTDFDFAIDNVAFY